ncbi:hypothetical protein AOC03_09280 [Psychrobacter urativorans]|uniref:Phosphatidic acid phosphatase type 2/haloperoxidase domain-containing protein n=2 Tax=Psychrobacter urativorans TaxID=45610 RepID=A0A0M4TFT6_9GAMM|nr:hypothetical protein AOC03_09280 [Psychrobacter urativorans]
MAHAVSNSVRVRYLALTLAIFYLLYTLTNSYSATLYEIAPSRVHNLAITFDNAIPFIPVMIVPYSWSLLLFVASFFMVRTMLQLVLLTRRLIVATIMACLIFYCYPARFSLHRPMPDDWTQIGYQFLMVTDKPFNQLPSLHVSYALLIGLSLWNVIDANKIWLLSSYRLLLVSVCGFIIASTVLTYQHHLLDVVGGIILAGIVFQLSHLIRNTQVSQYLVLGMMGFLLIAIAGFYISTMIIMTTLAERSVIENLSIVIALYWLVSFMTLAWAHQQPNAALDNNGFQKNSRGELALSTWIKFAPMLLIYNGISLIGQRYFKARLKTKLKTKLKKNNAQVTAPILYPINHSLFIVASPRLAQANVEGYLTHWLSSSGLLASAIPIVPYQIIVVDFAVEVSSHINKLKVASQCCSNNISKASSKARAKFKFNGHCHYFYFPLLDLRSLSDVSPKDYIHLFQQLDALTLSNDIQPTAVTDKNNIAGNPTDITLINFHCVMGLSRSVGVQVLYLVYCGTLTTDSYRAWIAHYYPHARLAEGYLPASLVLAIANDKRNPIH